MIQYNYKNNNLTDKKYRKMNRGRHAHFRAFMTLYFDIAFLCWLYTVFNVRVSSNHTLQLFALF